MDALKWQGEHPIIQPEGTSVEQMSQDGYSATIATRDLEPGDTVRISIKLPLMTWSIFNPIPKDKSITLTLRDSSGVAFETIEYGAGDTTPPTTTNPESPTSTEDPATPAFTLLAAAFAITLAAARRS